MSELLTSQDQLRQLLAELDLQPLLLDETVLELPMVGRRAHFVAANLRRVGVEARVGETSLKLTNRDDFPIEALATALRPQLLCLDIDNCLIETGPSFDETVFQTVAHFGGPPVEIEQILSLRAEGGFNDDNVVSWELLRRAGVEVELSEVFPVFRDLYIGTAEKPGLYTRETPLIQPEVFARLREAFPVALITGRNHEEGALARPILGIDDSLPMWTVDDVAQGKPDPEGILAAAWRFDARRVWMAGDNVDDIGAAIGAGAVPIGVGVNREALLTAGAAIVLEDINQIEELL